MDILSNPSYLIPPLVAFTISVLLAVVILYKDHRSATHRVFSLMLLSTALWGIFIFAMRTSPDTQYALFWDRLVVAAGIGLPVFYYHFTSLYTQATNRKLLWGAYLFLLWVCVIAPTDLVIREMVLESYGYRPEVHFTLYLISFGGLFFLLMGLLNLIRAFRAATRYEYRTQLSYMIVAIVFPFLGGIMDLFPTLPPAGMLGNVIFGLVTGIAVLKHHLLDIRIVARKGLLYLLVSAVIAIPYVSLIYLLHYIFEPKLGPWWMHGLIILLLAIILRPLYTWAQQLVDRLFYRDRYDNLRALEQFSQEAQSIMNLEELGSKLVQLVSGALRASSSCLLLLPEGRNDFVVISSTGLASPPSGVVLRNNSPLTKWLELHGDILSSEQLNVVPQLQSLSLAEKNSLERLGAKLYVPMKNDRGELSAILVLGEKLSQQSYSSEDKQLLKAVAGQMVMAIDKARLYNDALRARQNLEKWLESMTDGVMIVGTDYTIQFMNRAATEKLGSRVGEKCWETIAKDTVCSGCPVQNYVHGNMDSLYYSVSIGEREYDIAAAPLINPDGSLHIIEVLRDVTERKQAEEALRESEERYRALIRLGGEVGEAVIMVVDTDEVVGLHIFVSDEWSRITGYSKKKLLDMSFFDIVHPKYHAACLGRHHRRRQGENVPGLYEISIIRKDGTEVPIEITAAVTTYKGKPANVGYIRDITKRKRAEEREKQLQEELSLSSRLASVGELAAGVAHEVNNPLTGILGFSQRLLRKSTEETTRRDLERIYNEAQRAAKVVRNLLTFARRHEPKKEYSDINEILRKVLELRAYELRTSNIELVIEFAPDLPPIMTDFHQMQEVFLNIILNAEQAMTESKVGGKLTIKTREINGYIICSFTDDGPGIPAEHLDKLFAPFFTTRGGRSGTGLGLSVCHDIVTEHGGKIYAKSKPGKGATFTVELPSATEYPPNDDLP